MSEEKQHPLSREDLMFFLDFMDRRLRTLDEKELETRKRILRLDLKYQQDGWLYFSFEEQEDKGWRQSMVRLRSITNRRMKRASPLMQQTRAYARLEQLRVEIQMRIDRHLRMMNRLLEERGL
jgi:hypothetical protein